MMRSLSDGPWALRRRRTLAAVVLLTLTGAGLGGCTSIDGDTAITSLPATTGTAGSSANSSSDDLSAAPLATRAGGSLVPVYWLGDNGGTALLYREFLPADQDGDPIAAAVRSMTDGTPLDPDYFGSWSPAERVSASISPDNIITVDLSADAFAAKLDKGSAHRAVQQLVYTATAAAANAGLVVSGDPSSVVILVDGVAGFDAFGHVTLGDRMQRDTSLMAPIWVIEPQHGDLRNQSELTVAGSGVSEDALLNWRIDQVMGAELAPYRSGTVGLDESPGSSGLFEFSIALLPGEYEITVFDRPPNNQDEGEINPDTKRVIIQ